jgi:predicted nucleic acid-binding protein
MNFLVDSNVILDIVTEDAQWFSWSAGIIAQCSEEGRLWINPLIYSEVSIGFARIEDLQLALTPTIFRRAELPWNAAFLAGKAFLNYRKRSGAKSSPLPDFYIGAHAAIAGYILITRDQARYRTYFPKLKLICP